MVGVEVYNDQDQDLARIEYIAVGKDRHVQALFSNVGEYLGLVVHFVEVKPSALTIEASKGDGTFEARMDITADKLRAAPEYRDTRIRRACLNILRF